MDIKETGIKTAAHVGRHILTDYVPLDGVINLSIDAAGIMYNEKRYGNDVKGTTDVLRIMPKNMLLPIQGFKDNKYHVLVTTDHFKQILEGSNLGLRALTRGGARLIALSLAKYAIGKGISLGADLLTDDEAISEFAENPIVKYIHSLYALERLCFEWLNPRLHVIHSVQFFGLQPVTTGMGFTELKDNRIQSFQGNEFHTILSPYEYILFNQPIHVVDDGVVVDIVNRYSDRAGRRLDIQFARANIEEFLGNRVIIQHNPFIRSVYANVQKNSMSKLKIGDKVFRGDVIGRVGMSGHFPSPFLFFSTQLIGPKISNSKFADMLLGNLRPTISSRSQFWAPHFESNILDYEEQYGKNVYDLMERFASHKINYRMKGTQLGELCFVKQFRNIAVE